MNQAIKRYLISAWMILKTRQAVTYFLASFVTFVILYGSYLIYFPFLLEKLFNTSPFIIGVMLSCMSVTTAVTSSQLGKLSGILNVKSLLKISFFLYSSALIIIPFISNIWLLLIPIVIFGFAHGLNLPSLQILLADIAPIEYRGAFMSVNGMVLRIGQTLGPMLMAFIYITWGLDCTFYGGGIISIAMFLILSVLIK